MDPAAVRRGRLREALEIKRFGVFDYVWPEDCRDGKLVRTKWVDRMKGSEVKSRFCATEVAYDARGTRTRARRRCARSGTC